MTHLGDRVTPLVDGQLPPDVADRALAHAAGCPACRQAVEAERLTKTRLHALPDPEPSDGLVGRLMAMADPGGPVPPRAGPVPGAARAAPVPPPGRGPGVSRRPAGSGPAGARPPGRPTPVRGRRRARVMVGLAGLAALLGASGVTVAGRVDQGASVVPPVDSFVVEHASTSNLPFTDPMDSWTGR